VTVGTFVTVASNGTFQVNGSDTGHILSIGTDLTNNGVLDFSTGPSRAAGITFTGATSNTFGGTGGTTNIRTLTINKGTSSANILELTATNFTVQGATTDSSTAVPDVDQRHVQSSGAFTAAFRTFTSAAYTIGASTGFWLNNPNYTCLRTERFPSDDAGLLRVSQGTYNVGTPPAIQWEREWLQFTIEGGTSICRSTEHSQCCHYTQTGGTVNIDGWKRKLPARLALVSDLRSFQHECRDDQSGSQLAAVRRHLIIRSTARLTITGGTP
jgi:hypothetical protein